MLKVIGQYAKIFLVQTGEETGCIIDMGYGIVNPEGRLRQIANNGIAFGSPTDDSKPVLDLFLKKKMFNLLKAYEEWEGGLILDDKAWEVGAEFPTLTQPLYDKMMELQKERNRVLKFVEEK